LLLLFARGATAVPKLLAPSFIFGVVEAGLGLHFSNWSIDGLNFWTFFNLGVMHVVTVPPG
jgi:hypothetical protein